MYTKENTYINYICLNRINNSNTQISIFMDASLPAMEYQASDISVAMLCLIVQSYQNKQNMLEPTSTSSKAVLVNKPDANESSFIY